MQELDDDAKGEGDPQEAEGMAETYEVARSSGQTPQDAVATIAVVYETDEDDVKQKLRQYVRGHGRKKDGRHTGLCLEILKHMLETRRGSEERAEEVRKQANPSEARAPTPETSVPAYPQHFAPPPGLGGRSTTGGPAIRSLEGDSGRNPLLGSDGLVSQLFGGSEAARGREERRTVEDLFGESTTRAGAGTAEDPEVAARMMHVLEGIRKATEGDKKGTPGTRGALGAEESLDMYLARGCNTLKVEVLPDSTGKELFDGLKRACGHSKALLQEVDVDLADLKLGWICENAVGRVSKGGIYPLANSTASLFLQAISGACTLGIIDDPVRWPNLGPRDDENDLKRSFLFEYMYVPVWELTTIKNIPPFQTKVGFKSSLTQKVPRLFGCKRIFWFVSRV